MDFSWSQEQKRLRRAAYDLGLTFNEGFLEREKQSQFNHDAWMALAEFGLQAMPVPKQYGGGGADALTTVGVLESLGHGCEDNGLIFSANAQMWTVEMPILQFGTEEQKHKWLPRLCSGEIIGGNSMTEPDSGSDAYSLKTVAERKGDKYVLNGHKIFVSNGLVADVMLLFANAAPEKGPNGVTAFLVESDRPGYIVPGKPDKMGMKTTPMGELILENCEIPVENRLGKEGSGKNLFTHSMNWERSCILASAVGSMQWLLDRSVRYAKERKQFGQSIGKFQLVATKIVDIKMRLESSRKMLYHAAWMIDQGKSAFMEAAMTKLHISEAWVRCAEDAIQVHGGRGYLPEYGVERELRDAIGSRLYSGTSEVQRVIIAALLGL